MTDAGEDLRISRAFGWGLLIIADSTATDLDDVDPDLPVTWARDHAHVGVRHAQDVDVDDLELDDDDELPEAEVSVTVRLRAAAEDATAFDGVIEVPSGTITVGDADEEEALVVGAGSWRLQIDLDPPEHPTEVDIWVSPAAESR